MTVSALRVWGLALVPLAVISISACGGSDRSQPTAAPDHPRAGREAAVTVSDHPRQQIEGWGVSVVSDTENDPLVVPGMADRDLRQLDRLLFEQAGVNLVRVLGPGYGTQLETGDLRPRRGDPRFAFMRRVHRYGVRFMLTGADAPAALKAGPEQHGEGLAHGAEEAYARYLADLVRFARDEVGVPFDYVAIGNEPDNPRSLLTMPPSQAAQVYELLAKRLRSERSPPRLVIGDNTTWPTTLNYAGAALAQPSVAGAAAAIASHSYGGSSDDRSAVAELGRSTDLPVWQTEWGSGCLGCEDDPSMDVALRWSEQIAAGLVEGQTSAWFAFRGVASSGHGPGDALIVRVPDPAEPFYTTKRFEVFRHYSGAAGPGSRRLETRVEGSHLLAVGFRSRQGVAVVLTNLAAGNADLSLDLGHGTGELRRRITGPEASYEPLPSLEYAGDPVRLTLPAKGVATLWLKSEATPGVAGS